jgi:uncharacterized protein
MDLSENRTQHPNLIKSADDKKCEIGGQLYTQSIVIPFNDAVYSSTNSSAAGLTAQDIEQLCNHNPEIIILATGKEIVFPDAELLQPIAELNIGLEVLNNQAAARTFNVLLAEERNAVCLMLLG